MIISNKVFLVIILSVFVSQNYVVECAPVYDIIRTFLQWNIAGIPLVHKEVEFDFDPEVSQKRREQFYELHGFRADKLIERLGLGNDGNHKERKLEQQIRDYGHLQGLNYFTP